jgi:hypothetical protein
MQSSDLHRMQNRSGPSIRTVPMNLFPTLGSLQEVVDLAESKVPVTSRNEMYSLLMTYHNSLLKVIEDEKKKKP